MYARALGGGEVIDAPPTHLQENEGNDEHPEGQPIAMARELTIMYIYKVCKPGDGGPRLLGVPRPVVAPGFLRPECAKKHTDGEKGKAYIDEVVG